MKKIILLICFSVVLLSCKKQQEIAFEMVTYQQKSTLPCEEGACTEVIVKIPHALSKDSVSKRINEQVFDIVKEIVVFDQDNERFKTYEEAINSFITSYEDIKKQFPNEPVPWEAKIESKYTVFGKELVNIDMDHYTFTGGAHGSQGVISVFYDLATGKEVAQKDLFVNYEGFKNLAKKKFYAMNHLEENVSLNEKGYMFEDDKFYLAENIIINNEELIVRYNHYEIAPYAQGPTELKFSYKEIKSYLNPLYFKE